MEYGLIVCDASPLITLSRADQLDVLLKQPWPITVPDAVYREAANEAHADGVSIARWIETNQHRVRVAATEAGVEQDVLIRAGLKARNAGENAALEVINRFLESAPDQRAVLLYEDDDVRKFPVLDRADIVTTGVFLSALEMAGAIQSADFILEEAARAGRNVSAQQIAALETPLERLVDGIMAGKGDPSAPSPPASERKGR